MRGTRNFLYKEFKSAYNNERGQPCSITGSYWGWFWQG